MRFSPSCGCCGPPACNEYTDSLAADTDWTEEVGNWTFTSGSGGYAETTDSDSQLIYQGVDSAILTASIYAFYARLTPGSTNDDLNLRSIFNWEDTDNYWFGEAELDTTNLGGGSFGQSITVRVGVVVAGSETILEENTTSWTTGFPSTISYLDICFENGLVTVSSLASPFGATVYTNVALVSGAKFGVGTGDQTGMDTARVSQYDLTILLDDEDHTCVDCDLPTLPSCPDACEQGYAAEEYSLEVAGFSVGTCGDCSAINGTFSLTHTTGCVWRSGDIDVCGATHQYRLEIDDTAGIQVFLEQTDPASGDVFSWVATDDGEGAAPWNCLRWTDITLDKDTGDDVPCGTVPLTVSLSAVRPF